MGCILDNLETIKFFKAFGWLTQEVDGHEVDKVCDVLSSTKSNRNLMPKVVLANTIKGRGVPGLENQRLSHIMNPTTQILNELLGISDD